MGAALARRYANAGVTLHLLGRNIQRLEVVADACRAQSATVYAASIDVCDAAAMALWIAGQDAICPIDLVIANAGISAGTGEVGESETQARSVLEVNIQGVLNSIWPVITLMMSRNFGTISIISSVAGMYPMPTAPAYSASKACVRYYGEALRAQLKRKNISVVMVYPGFIRTPMTQVNAFPMPFIMSAEEAAQRIFCAIACGKPHVSFPKSMIFCVRILNLLPQSWVHKLLSRVPSKPSIS